MIFIYNQNTYKLTANNKALLPTPTLPLQINATDVHTIIHYKLYMTCLFDMFI